MRALTHSAHFYRPAAVLFAAPLSLRSSSRKPFHLALSASMEGNILDPKVPSMMEEPGWVP